MSDLRDRWQLPPLWPPSWLTAAVAAAGLLLALVIGLIVAVTLQPSTDDSTRDEALAAARQAAVDFGTYDYRHIEDDFHRLLAESTGPTMRNQVNQAIRTLVPALRQGKATSSAKVLSAGVSSVSDKEVVVLAAVDETVANTTVPRGTIKRYRFVMTMTKVHGHWLVSDLQQA